jgi:hypothetical protein
MLQKIGREYLLSHEALKFLSHPVVFDIEDRTPSQEVMDAHLS